MNNDKLVKSIRHHYAISAVGPSVARNMIRKGDIERIRTFLDRLSLGRFSNPATFHRVLNRATASLARLLPQDRWGAARKFLNIYLRNVTYNYYLRRAYGLHRIERLLEIPMDSFAAKQLRKRREGRELPRWKGVIHLTREDSARYQEVAARVAERELIHRIHLDVLFWRASEKA
ncbi:hypothetical protein [Bradyrhizobium australafricanum]|uniref:hypothetical protein n=1 Tax=Bradyrhizobium australafricanum TaxID=2821406 RepID=UPI001CE2DB16|nr:hypothetical protein [Bradyrhizobium australafricanum]MCA6097624.1 hypothetical protein [Bradyrhizobium australafricanum]